MMRELSGPIFPLLQNNLKRFRVLLRLGDRIPAITLHGKSQEKKEVYRDCKGDYKSS